MRNLLKTNSAKIYFDVIISSIFIKYSIQSYRLCIGAHIFPYTSVKQALWEENPDLGTHIKHS